MSIFDGNNLAITKDGTALGQVVSIKMPEVTYASIKTTNTDSTTHEQRQGLAQLTTCDVVLQYDPSLHDGLKGSGNATWVVTVTGADSTAADGTITWDGYVSNWGITGNETDNNVDCNLSIQPKGDFS